MVWERFLRPPAEEMILVKSAINAYRCFNPPKPSRIRGQDCVPCVHNNKYRCRREEKEGLDPIWTEDCLFWFPWGGTAMWLNVDQQSGQTHKMGRVSASNGPLVSMKITNTSVPSCERRCWNIKLLLLKDGFNCGKWRTYRGKCLNLLWALCLIYCAGK